MGTSQSFTYDNANRLLTTNAGSGPWVHRYDAAGNDTAQTYGTGRTVRQQFDAGNRLTRRIVPERTFPRRRCQGFPAGPLSDPAGGLGCQLQFPYYANDGADGYVIAADTSVFAYDALGRLHLANNRFARITREYTPSGLLRKDSVAMGIYNTPSVDDVPHVQLYTYDRDGRRSTMAWRAGPTTYTYTNFGALGKVTDRDGNTYTLAYDAQGRVDSLAIAPAGGSVRVWETRDYDLDGRLVRRERVSLDPTVGRLYLDSLWLDQRGNLAAARLRSKVQQTQGVRYAYNPQGAVVAQARTRDLGGYQVEEFRNDAYGNVFYARTRSSAGTNDAPFISGYTPDGGLVLREAVLSSTPTQNERNVWLEQTTQGGAATLTSRLEREPVPNGGQWIEQVASRSYYSADNRLMVVQRYDEFPSPGTTIDLGTWEEYWYDALGRRILTRARRDQVTKPDTSHYLCNAAPACGSYKQRTLWDGAQLLYEWRTPQSTATGMTSGSAGYVYLNALDQPIALLRSEGTRVLNYTARGLAESSVFVDGSSGDCSIFETGCTRVDWPAKTQGAVYFTPNLLASGPSGPYTWFGTLADNGGGSTGMLYRRNRYFDPVNGQFTQQDPIGVGGGMNLWGFADGDPVNYSDPFGLCPENEPNCDDLTGSQARAVFQMLVGTAPSMQRALQVGTALSFAPALLMAAAPSAAITSLGLATTAARVGGPAAAVVSGLSSKGAARQALSGLDVTLEQAAAARSAISRGTASSTYELIQHASGNLFVHIYRAGRNGFQVFQSVISPSGSKVVTQYGIDTAGRVLADPKFP